MKNFILLAGIVGLITFSLLSAEQSTPSPRMPPACNEVCDCGCNEGGPCLWCCAAPDKKDAPKDAPKEKELPNLIGATNWGAIAQNGRDIVIQGHPAWSAAGRVNEDGTVSLLWTDLLNGETAPSHYRFVRPMAEDNGPDDLRGDWGFSDRVKVNSDFTVTGEVRPDLIRWARPEIR